MEYVLKQFDMPLLRFSATTDTSEPEIEILWHDADHIGQLPLDLTLTPESLSKWLRHRTIPKNRAYVHALLAKCGLNLNRPMSIIRVCKALSLNDCYWVAEDEDNSKFAKINLYDNPFSNVLAALAFTGYGSSVRSSLTSSPEFTTNGILRKCWRRINGKIYLYKGGTEGAANTGFEPYSEFYAAQVAQAMGINAIPYGLSRWKGTLCSTCELFTSKEYAFLPIGRLVTHGGFKAVTEYYRQLGPTYLRFLGDMLIFDALICNVDRHFGNFGFLIDNQTNQIVSPAPLFDHGNSLFHFAGQDVWQSQESLDEYIETLLPSVYDDFLGTAQAWMTSEHRQKLRHLLQFRFKKHSRYNLPKQRLRMIEAQIQKRAKILLEA